ncbi:hypothetical protein B0H13DRAFT_1867666 [Mycena leptocephala]|nr:hypothetical protein B0H13DRAFT_1900308 [Mycena leptocephala]KAJ7920328.1 hypothetical protein B0H13DRAFT_1867666 [Mycena leptocephala]
MFFNKDNKDKHTAIRFRRFGTMKQFMDHPHVACEITIGLAVFWTSTPVFHKVRDYHRFSLAVLTPVSHKVEERMAQSLHCNLVLLIHAPKVQGKASPGKVLVIGEPNITKEHDGKVKTTDVLFSRMVKMIKSVHNKAVWVNHQRTERNVSGHCLALVLEWMVDLVVGGVSKLAIARNGKGAVMAIEGFPPMKKYVHEPPGGHGSIPWTLPSLNSIGKQDSRFLLSGTCGDCK